MTFRHLFSGAIMALLLTMASMLPAAPADEHSRFMAENEASMERMMTAMNVKPSGDVDRDFAAMMIPQTHQTNVSLFDQGLVQVLQASVTGLKPMQSYVIALADKPDGTGKLQPLAAFNTNPAGAAIVDTVGPIRQIVRAEGAAPRRWLVIATGTVDQVGAVVQTERPVKAGDGDRVR
jgi:hypothetical protein